MKLFRIRYYFKEVFNRFFYGLVSFFITFFILSIYSYEILYLFITPYTKNYIFTEGSEVFFQLIFLNIFLSFFINLPYFFYHFLCFLSPILKKSKKLEYIFLFLFFFFTYLFTFYICKKFSHILFHFFLNQSIHNFFYEVHSEIRITSVIYTIKQLFFFPIYIFVIFCLSIRFSQKVSRQKAWFFLILIFSIIVPPDILTQSFFTILLLFLYEFGCYLSYLKNEFFRRRNAIRSFSGPL